MSSPITSQPSLAETLVRELLPALRQELSRLGPLGATQWRLVPDTAIVAPPPVPAHTPTRDHRSLRFAVQGRMRSITYGEEQGWCANTVGCRAIAALLERPGQAIPAITLKADLDGVHRDTFRGGRIEQVDGQTLRELEQRYRDLQDDLAEAERRQDPRAQERIEEEMGILAETCRTLMGKDGQGRRSSDAERIRVSLTNAIRRSLWKMARGGAVQAAAYFRRTIRTGSLLAFLPESSERWDLA